MGDALEKTMADFSTLDEDEHSYVKDIRKNRISGSCYEGFSMVARGGMGTILKTTDMNCGREIAMKMALNSEEGHESLTRLLHEAKITANLEHPNIVPVHEISCDDKDNVYFTMKYVQGDDLGVVLRMLKEKDPVYVENFSLARLLAIFLRVCDGLAFAHSKGVIHRDLKPENIMIGEYGEVLIMDWGIAKVLNDKTTFDSLEEIKSVEYLSKNLQSHKGAKETQSGEVFGTPAFMAPEQILGKNDEADNRTDIYALGGLLYNILSLRMPIPEKDIHVLFPKVLAGEITSPSDLICSKKSRLPHVSQVPEALSAVCMKALSVDPEERYQNVKDLQAEIRAYEAGYATKAQDASKLKKLKLLFNRNVILFFLMIFIVSTAVFSFFRDKITDRDARALQEDYEANLRELLLQHEVTNRTLDSVRRKAVLLMDLADRDTSLDKLEKAKSTLAVVSLLAPENPRLYYQEGLIMEKEGNLIGAIRNFRTALKKSPRYKNASNALARCVALKQ